MPKLRYSLLLFSAAAFVFVLAAYGQDDAPSLGDVARQARQQRQQKDAQVKDAQNKDAVAKDASGKDAQGSDKDATAKNSPAAKTPHVITNEEIPEHVGPTSTRPTGSPTPVANYTQPTYDQPKLAPEYWKSQIMAQKNAIANLKANIDSLNASIQYAGGNCVSGCVEWNLRQKQKQDQVEMMKAQLEQQQKYLEDMQEAARKQGYGSSVYDP